MKVDSEIRKSKVIEYPDSLHVGKHIFVIECEDRTGNPDAVYENRVTAIGTFWSYFWTDTGFYYSYIGANTPEYFAAFDEIGKTIFFTREEAEKALKKGSYK